MVVAGHEQATVIASQATISGTFFVRQAGDPASDICPRMQIVQDVAASRPPPGLPARPSNWAAVCAGGHGHHRVSAISRRAGRRVWNPPVTGTMADHHAADVSWCCATGWKYPLCGWPVGATGVFPCWSTAAFFLCQHACGSCRAAGFSAGHRHGRLFHHAGPGATAAPPGPGSGLAEGRGFR